MTQHDEGSKKSPPLRPDPRGLADYSDRLHKFYMRRFRNRDGASDMVQEAYRRILQKEADGEMARNPLSYLYKTLENTAIRQAKREKASGIVTDTEQLNAALDTRAASSSERPDEAVAIWLTYKHLLRSLRRPLRRIFFLDVVLGYSDDEIAKRMKFSPHTVRIYKTKARARCRQAWEDRIK